MYKLIIHIFLFPLVLRVCLSFPHNNGLICSSSKITHGHIYACTIFNMAVIVGITLSLSIWLISLYLSLSFLHRQNIIQTNVYRTLFNHLAANLVVITTKFKINFGDVHMDTLIKADQTLVLCSIITEAASIRLEQRYKNKTFAQ